jgi:hypothetical protein
MANLSLGAYTFDINPLKMAGIIKPMKKSAIKYTYDNVAFFSWAASIKGVVIVLEWELMSTDQFTEIDDLYQVGDTVVFNPQDGTGKTYNVEIVNFDGNYFVYLGLEDEEGNYRENVKLELLIMSEV